MDSTGGQGRTVLIAKASGVEIHTRNSIVGSGGVEITDLATAGSIIADIGTMVTIGEVVMKGIAGRRPDLRIVVPVSGAQVFTNAVSLVEIAGKLLYVVTGVQVNGGRVLSAVDKMDGGVRRVSARKTGPREECLLIFKARIVADGIASKPSRAITMDRVNRTAGSRAAGPADGIPGTVLAAIIAGRASRRVGLIMGTGAGEIIRRV